MLKKLLIIVAVMSTTLLPMGSMVRVARQLRPSIAARAAYSTSDAANSVQEDAQKSLDEWTEKYQEAGKRFGHIRSLSEQKSRLNCEIRDINAELQFPLKPLITVSVIGSMAMLPMVASDSKAGAILSTACISVVIAAELIQFISNKLGIIEYEARIIGLNNHIDDLKRYAIAPLLLELEQRKEPHLNSLVKDLRDANKDLH